MANCVQLFSNTWSDLDLCTSWWIFYNIKTTVWKVKEDGVNKQTEAHTSYHWGKKDILGLNHVFALLYQYVHDIVCLHECLWLTTSRPPKSFSPWISLPRTENPLLTTPNTLLLPAIDVWPPHYFFPRFTITDSFLFAITAPLILPLACSPALTDCLGANADSLSSV